MWKRINELGKEKYFANKGVKRNKRPLQNIKYKIELTTLTEGFEPSKYEKYKFKDLGVMNLYWTFEKEDFWCWHGLITIDQLKELIGQKQYGKFCQGKREFIIQRRINKKNL